MGYVETAKVKQKKGFATALDVYRANIQLKQAETLLTSSRSQYLDAKDHLKIILAIPLENEIEVKAPLEYTFTKIDASESISTALQKRVELEEVNDMISDYERRISYARHNLLPRLDLALRYRSSGVDSNFIDSLKKNTGRVEMSFYSSGDISRIYERAEYTRSKMALKNVYRVLSLKKDEIIREVKNAIRNLNRLEKNIFIQKKQIHDAKGKMELSRVKFSHGMANNFDLIESEAQYREAETGYISSIIDYIEGKYQLKAVMGILLDEFGFKRNH
jgi:outer membrane protein TolC